jgi:hypothetical protein
MLEIKTSIAQAMSAISMVRSSIIENLDKCVNFSGRQSLPYDITHDVNGYSDILKEHIRGLSVVEPSLARSKQFEELYPSAEKFGHLAKEYLARIDKISTMVREMDTRVIPSVSRESETGRSSLTGSPRPSG